MSDTTLRQCEVCGTHFPARHPKPGRFCSRKCQCLGMRLVSRTPDRAGARFFAKVDCNGPVPAHCPELGQCHIWTGCREANGYGRLRFRKKGEYAHRMAWFLAHGRWPDPCALHKCDGGPLGCVRIDHLFEGTKADNSQDMAEKGRTGIRPKLNEDAIRDVRLALARGETHDAIAQKHGVVRDTVGAVSRGKSHRRIC